MTIILGKVPQGATVLGIDLETSSLDPYTGRLLSIAFSDGETTWILLDIHGFEGAKQVLLDPAVVKIAHNAKFDLKWIKHKLGIEVVNFYCTQLAEKSIHNGKKLLNSLIEVAARRVGVLLNKDTREEFHDHPGFAVRPVTSEQLKYMAEDVLYLPRIYRQQVQEIRDADLGRTMQLEFDCIPAVIDLELGGISFDAELWQQQIAMFQLLIEEYTEKMQELVGEDFVLHMPARRKKQDVILDLPINEINFGSTKQLQEVFKQRFKLTVSTTKEEMLTNIIEGRYALDKKTDPDVIQACRLMLGIRHFNKRMTYGYDRFINPVTGKIHASYNQDGTDTGRFSSSEPNMQQVPKPVEGEPNMRNLFLADSEDYVIIRADYSQQEPRVMAQMSGDKAMIAACNQEDVYIEFGKTLFGRTIEKLSDERHMAKTGVLAIAYGGGAKTLAAKSGKSEEECYEFKATVQRTFPVMAAYAKRMERQACMYGYVTTALGRRRYFDKVLFTEAVNSPIQGTAADMMKLAIIKIHRWLTEQKNSGTIDPNSRIVNTVHDEIEVQCHKDELDYVDAAIKRLMEEAGHALCPDVKHFAETAYGYRWDK